MPSVENQFWSACQLYFDASTTFFAGLNMHTAPPLVKLTL
ncbi:hypothetical protein VCRA2110O318_40160 [Vibrio crassostreae]|nr:hypothetical protein VCRA2117O328_40162 [Vibrio crassostreae]CAK2337856.1 hypothetical protein VCRA2110O318_40160 [Vibrio crassostreae]CAK2507235.1 hypothetical protein VCRA2110O319_50161 [Vibrio crassostreae]CAK2898810.1 hypothetical protein VCRA217O317_30131 [Vibrio crassostreae]